MIPRQWYYQIAAVFRKAIPMGISLLRIAAAVSLILAAASLILWLTGWHVSIDVPTNQIVLTGGGRFSNHVYVDIPWWYPLTVFSILPILWCRRVFAESQALQRRREGRCTCCGYDLRATPDRCPECGAVPEAAKGVAT